jgi:hypothetical protein
LDHTPEQKFLQHRWHSADYGNCHQKVRASFNRRDLLRLRRAEPGQKCNPQQIQKNNDAISEKGHSGRQQDFRQTDLIEPDRRLDIDFLEKHIQERRQANSCELNEKHEYVIIVPLYLDPAGQ